MPRLSMLTALSITLIDNSPCDIKKNQRNAIQLEICQGVKISHYLHGTLDGAVLHGEVVDGAAGEQQRY